VANQFRRDRATRTRLRVVDPSHRGVEASHSEVLAPAKSSPEATLAPDAKSAANAIPAPDATTSSDASATADAKLSPEWIGAMLLDVTSHLMNAIDRAARLREPIERLAAAAEASAEATEVAIERGRRPLRPSFVAALSIVAALVVAIPLAIHMYPAPINMEVVAYNSIRPGQHGFIIGGVRYDVTREVIANRLSTVAPEPIHKYWVDIDGRRYPVKQAVAIGLGAERAVFSSSQAIRVLRELGFNQGETTE